MENSSRATATYSAKVLGRSSTLRQCQRLPAALAFPTLHADRLLPMRQMHCLRKLGCKTSPGSQCPQRAVSIPCVAESRHAEDSPTFRDSRNHSPPRPPGDPRLTPHQPSSPYAQASPRCTLGAHMVHAWCTPCFGGSGKYEAAGRWALSEAKVCLRRKRWLLCASSPAPPIGLCCPGSPA